MTSKLEEIVVSVVWDGVEQGESGEETEGGIFYY